MYDLNDGEFDLTMYVPTKGRPDNAFKLEAEFYATTKLNSRIVLIISDNDPLLDQYLSYPFLDDPIVVSPTRAGFVSPLNLGYLVDRRKVYSYAVGFMGDDHMPRTIGWDERFVNELIDLKTGLVYANDGLQHEAIPTQIAMTSDIPLTLGYMTVPALWHLYADNFWLDLGNKIGKIKYLSDVLIEHMHPAIGKANSDAGYEFSGAFTLDAMDKATYQRYLENDLELDAKKIIGMMRRTRTL
jgi:hypothetical protein